MSELLSQFLAINIGTTALRAESYVFANTPKVEEGKGRVGCSVKLTVKGELVATSAADLAAKLAAMHTDLQTGGRTVTVTGPAGKIELVLAAPQCLNRGPHVEYQVLEQSPGMFARAVQLVVTAETPVAARFDGGSSGDGNQDPKPTEPPADTYGLTVSAGPSGLRTIKRTGTVHGPGAGTYVAGVLVPQAVSDYPPPKWLVSYESGFTGGSDLQATYTVTAVETTGLLPAGAVDGEVTYRKDVDEHGRQTCIAEYDLVATGDAYALASRLRPSGVTIIRESVQVTTVKEPRVRASFTWLVGEGGGRLLTWSQSVRIQRPAAVYAEKNFLGAAPILVLRERRFARLIQTGQATGLGVAIAPPAPLAPDAMLADPEITIAHSSPSDVQTSWSYQMAIDDAAAEPEQWVGQLARPAAPQLLGPMPGGLP